jgi:hypothetical protein
LFDSLVKPILLYGSEVWGYENLKILERVHLQFCKRILNLRLSTPNVMVYGGLQVTKFNLNLVCRDISETCSVKDRSYMRNSSEIIIIIRL